VCEELAEKTTKTKSRDEGLGMTKSVLIIGGEATVQHLFWNRDRTADGDLSPQVKLEAIALGEPLSLVQSDLAGYSSLRLHSLRTEVSPWPSAATARGWWLKASQKATIEDLHLGTVAMVFARSTPVLRGTIRGDRPTRLGMTYAWLVDGEAQFDSHRSVDKCVWGSEADNCAECLSYIDHQFVPLSFIRLQPIED
jgi:hypothetical protein